MKNFTYLTMSAMVCCTLLNGCSDPSSGLPPPNQKKELSQSGVSAEFKMEVCSDVDNDYICDDTPSSLTEFKPIENNGTKGNAKTIARLSSAGDIAVTEFSNYEGFRYLILPAEEKNISATNALAFGLSLYAQQAGADWCGPCKMVAPQSYQEAKEVLTKEFNLTGTEQQNEALLATINHNLELLGNQGLELKLAYEANIKAMAEELVNLTVKYQQSPDLSGLMPIKSLSRIIGSAIKIESPIPNPPCYLDPFNPCEDDQDPTLLLSISNHQAAQIAFAVREKEGKPSALDKIMSELHCEDNQQQDIHIYGIVDNFSNTNSELTNPSANLSSLISSYAGYVHPYDYNASLSTPNFFAETLTGLPSNATSGLFIIGLKEKGVSLAASPSYIDYYSIGSGFLNTNISGQIHDLRASWQNSGDIYFNQLSSMTNAANESLLDRLQSGQTDIDVVIGITTNVDFIAVASCRDKPKPTGAPIKDVIAQVTKDFSCPTGTQYSQVTGGQPDNFATPIDATTLSSSIIFNNLISYDQSIEKSAAFADSLPLTNNSIVKAQLLVNARSLSASSLNDKILFGENSSTNSNANIGGFLTASSGVLEYPTANAGTAYAINQNHSVGSGTLLDALTSGIANLDVLAFWQTEVDVTLLQLCIKEDNSCIDTDGDGFCDDEEIELGSDPFNPNSTPGDLDGDGHPNDEDCDPTNPLVWDDCVVFDKDCEKKITVDLRPATTWIDTATSAAPVENNVFSTYPPNPAWANVIWDGAMNWFDFGSANNTTHTLKVDFCSCGGGEVTVDEMKSDNYSHVYLDDSSIASNTLVQRTVHNQSTMASWGTSVNGYKSIPATGANEDHTLFFEVKNASGPSGGSINGELSFYGQLGHCP
jgi:thiol-disulfide isomerase/thioredoxin